MKTSSTLTDEWMVVLDKVIAGKHDGTIREKVRGQVNNCLLVDMKLARKKTVELIHSEGLRVRDRFKAILLSKWADKHPDNPDPRAAGFQVKKVKLQGKIQDVVLMRIMPEGEYDLEFESSMQAVMREEHDSGECDVRETSSKSRWTR